jgi:hypothetical protein
MNRRNLMIAALGCLTPPIIKATETTVVWKTSAVGMSESGSFCLFKPEAIYSLTPNFDVRCLRIEES